nr:hypothetical protein [uncultured Cohaesibacter sp.]
MSKDLLEAAYRDFDKAVQQHEQNKTHASEKALYEARINVLSIRNDLRERKIKVLSREVERLQETLALGPDSQDQSIGDLAGQIVERLSPRQKAEALFKGAAE